MKKFWRNWVTRHRLSGTQVPGAFWAQQPMMLAGEVGGNSHFHQISSDSEHANFVSTGCKKSVVDIRSNTAKVRWEETQTAAKQENHLSGFNKPSCGPSPDDGESGSVHAVVVGPPRAHQHQRTHVWNMGGIEPEACAV